MSLPHLDLERQRKARELARRRRWLFVVDTALTLAFLAFLMASGISFDLRDALVLPDLARTAAYVAVIIAAYSLILLPLEWYEEYVLPRRYGLQEQRFRGWSRDKFQSVILELLLGVGMLVALYWLMGSFPRTWWLLASALVVIVTALATDLTPVIVFPLFFKMRRLEDQGLCERLRSLLERAKLRAIGIYTMESSRRGPGANAGLMGLGNTRRIVITDVMVNSYAPEEIEAVVAHELGHDRHGDILRLMAFQSALVLAGFYLLHLVLDYLQPVLGYSGPGDIGVFPVLALFTTAYLLIVSPLTNSYGRSLESRADGYALRLTGNPDAFVTVMARLTDQYLAEGDPARWVEVLSYDHPSYRQRLAAAERFSSQKGVQVA